MGQLDDAWVFEKVLVGDELPDEDSFDAKRFVSISAFLPQITSMTRLGSKEVEWMSGK